MGFEDRDVWAERRDRRKDWKKFSWLLVFDCQNQNHAHLPHGLGNLLPDPTMHHPASVHCPHEIVDSELLAILDVCLGALLNNCIMLVFALDTLETMKEQLKDIAWGSGGRGRQGGFGFGRRHSST